MSDLSLFGDKRMTVKEVAEALGTAESTIRNKAAELFPESVKNGVATLLDEKQVYEIKTNLVPRDLTLKSKLEDAEMALDIEMMTIKVIAYHKAEADRLRAALAVATPKAELADRLTSSSDAIDHGCRRPRDGRPRSRATIRAQHAFQYPSWKKDSHGRQPPIPRIHGSWVFSRYRRGLRG